MTAHIRFTLRLYLRSGRWLAPLMLFATWFGFAIVNSPPALTTSSSLVPAILACGTWAAVSVGGLDDRNHRELMAAAAGSPARLHIARALASFVVCVGVALICVAYIAIKLDQPDMSAATVALINGVALVAASALAATIGSWLHPPLIAQRAVAVLIGLAVVSAVLWFPPVGATLKSLGNANFGRTFVFGVVSLAVGVVGVAASSRMANRS